MLILRIFKYSGNSVKARIISLTLLLFISVGRMVLKSYTYMTYIYLFNLLDVMGKRPHRSEYIPLLRCNRVHGLYKSLHLFCSFLPGLYLEVSLQMTEILVFPCAGAPWSCSLIFQDDS